MPTQQRVASASIIVLLELGGCGHGPGATDAVSDSSTTEQDDTSLESSGSEADTDEPLPECGWNAVPGDQCSASAATTVAPEGTEDLYNTPSIAVGPDGTVHVLFSKEHRVGLDSVPRILSYVSNASGEWVEQEFDLHSDYGYAKIQVSDTSVIRASSGVYLRNDSGTFVRPAPFEHAASQVNVGLTAARELDLAYLITRDFADHTSYTVWSEEQGCVRQLWTMPACEPFGDSFTEPYNMNIAVAPSGGAPVVVAEMDDFLTLTDLGEPSPEIRTVGSSRVWLLGDVEIDETGRVHVCFSANEGEDGIVWASGLEAEDWQEQIVPGTAEEGVADGLRCQLAVSADGSELWLTNSISQLSIQHMHDDTWDVEDLRLFLPPGHTGLLLDVALGIDGQPVVVGYRNSPDRSEQIWFVTRRLGDAQWLSEVIAVNEQPP